MQHYPPWGTVSPAFWHAPSAPHRPKAALPATRERRAAAPARTSHNTESPGDPSPPPPPEHYRARITALNALVNAQDSKSLTTAAVEAERLDQEVTAEFGQHHGHTIQIRELRGWLAHLAGDHATATLWYLHTAAQQSLQSGPAHPLTRASLRRAAHIWFSVTDPAAATALGQDLLRLTAASDGSNSEMYRHVTARMTTLTGTRSQPDAQRR
jgi:hypothetical protein